MPPDSAVTLPAADPSPATDPGAQPAGTGHAGPPPAGAGSAGPEPTGAAPAGSRSAGPELARAVLDAARAHRQAARTARRPRGDGTGEPRRRRGYTGPGPDPRDPQLFGSVIQRLLKSRGWQQSAAEATVLGAWERVVGAEIASHSRPVKLDDGELTVEAESTAWATQLRLLQATLLRNIAGEVGHGVVRRLRIHGPAAPSWSRGPLRVRGKGPGDTYG
ncbi:DUF721 domain-containing protein [Pilimelia anulata]|uniref:DUF721 domain-containing protein n=1 Tax=Pilimelia anulata TaxID=53371 RepID=UPI0035709A19